MQESTENVISTALNIMCSDPSIVYQMGPKIGLQTSTNKTQWAQDAIFSESVSRHQKKSVEKIVEIKLFQDINFCQLLATKGD